MSRFLFEHTKIAAILEKLIGVAAHDPFCGIML